MFTNHPHKLSHHTCSQLLTRCARSLATQPLFPQVPGLLGSLGKEFGILRSLLSGPLTPLTLQGH